MKLMGQFMKTNQDCKILDLIEKGFTRTYYSGQMSFLNLDMVHNIVRGRFLYSVWSDLFLHGTSSCTIFHSELRPVFPCIFHSSCCFIIHENICIPWNLDYKLISDES